MKVRYITIDKDTINEHTYSGMVYLDNVYGFESDEELAKALGNEFQEDEVLVIDLQTMTLCEITKKVELIPVKNGK